MAPSAPRPPRRSSNDNARDLAAHLNVHACWARLRRIGGSPLAWALANWRTNWADSCSPCVQSEKHSNCVEFPVHQWCPSLRIAGTDCLRKVQSSRARPNERPSFDDVYWQTGQRRSPRAQKPYWRPPHPRGLRPHRRLSSMSPARASVGPASRLSRLTSLDAHQVLGLRRSRRHVSERRGFGPSFLGTSPRVCSSAETLDSLLA